MTQASSNTLVFTQILTKLSEFYQKDLNGMFKDDTDRVEAYSSILKELYEKISRPMTNLDPFVKGEPPFSEKLNKFSQNLARDINAAALEVDYLSAKTVNLFNLIKTEIDREKKYVDRISSKSKILKMYNRSPSDDLVYYGDSFENSDKIDVAKITQGSLPMINNGSASFGVQDSREWVVTSVYAREANLLGKLGNNHEVRVGSSEGSDTVYKYVFEDSPNLGIATNIHDSNPLTSFECEVLSLDKSEASPLVNEKEFCYVLEDDSIPGLSAGTLLNWSVYDMNNPLEVKVKLTNRRLSKANAIDISPFFASMDFVEVSSILVYGKDGSSEEVLHTPIYIGSSMAPTNLDYAASYSYNQATVRFEERYVSEIEITFIQRVPKDILVQHLYWVPDYAERDDDDDNDNQSPFYGVERFNPDSLSSESFEEVRFDYKSILPQYSKPALYKALPDVRKTVSVTTKKVDAVYSSWVIVLPMALSGDSDVRNYYFENWVSQENSEQDSISFSSELKIGSSYDVRYFSSEDLASEDVERIKEWIVENQTADLGNDTYSFVAGSSTFEIDINNIEVTFFQKTEAQSEVIHVVPLRSEKELYQAKRMVVGIRDISVYYESYSSSFEIVSKPYVFNFPVDSIMLSVDSNVDNTFSQNINILYYISVDGGNSWINISPIQLDNQGIPEIISFNNNVPSDFELPGVLYMNYPDIPDSIDNVIVKIEGTSTRGENVTPEIRSYELIAKVKR